MGQPKLKSGSWKRAVAIKYIPGKDRAPKVTAKGQGLLAEKIIEIARQHGIPIQEDLALIQVLSQLDLYEEIPSETYLVVAEILSFVYRMNRKWISSKLEVR